MEFKELRAIFRHSHQSRVIHADGAWGGVTPSRLIHMALYSEHNALPSEIVYDVIAPGIGQQRPVAPTGNLTREIEVEVIFSVDVAKRLVGWLNEKIETIETTQVPTLDEGDLSMDDDDDAHNR